MVNSAASQVSNSEGQESYENQTGKEKRDRDEIVRAVADNGIGKAAAKNEIGKTVAKENEKTFK